MDKTTEGGKPLKESFNVPRSAFPALCSCYASNAIKLTLQFTIVKCNLHINKLNSMQGMKKRLN